MKIKIIHTTPYLQESRNIQVGDEYDVLQIGKREDTKEMKGEKLYIIQPPQGNYTCMYAHEVVILSSNDK